MSIITTPACHNAQHTSYEFQSRMESGDGIMSMITPSTYHNAQLTHYDFQSKLEVGNEIMSMITPTRACYSGQLTLCDHPSSTRNPYTVTTHKVDEKRCHSPENEETTFQDLEVPIDLW